MVGVVVFMGVFAPAFLAFALVDPRRAWWRFQAGRFENPEPLPGQSKQAYAVDNLMYSLKTKVTDRACE
ncbi:hypothetical protein HRW23_00065 [Streptomyces lunaelactis]|uniref:hypothetical protein n=1 Tax=Streptomyces lunaelactis TaxID=1535768 RepID=UPI001584CECE|nr:hypothetical protein [Streptomyces lunaelactis]NUK60632.1 hypothetical protein [Streptomyces lunaelactis]NUK73471.1 hypothetical protein [Streptomyces lunaelactis]NUK75813.1 hypothetical protein [Streptomyces lunaelactis]